MAACRPFLQGRMAHTMEHPEEASKLQGLQRQVREVQQVMENNITQVRVHMSGLRSQAYACISACVCMNGYGSNTNGSAFLGLSCWSYSLAGCGCICLPPAAPGNGAA